MKSEKGEIRDYEHCPEYGEPVVCPYEDAKDNCPRFDECIQETERRLKDTRMEVAEDYRNKPAGEIFPDAPKKIEEGICTTCGDKVGEFRNHLSLKEFGISGMCQKCQDSVFGVKKK